MKHFIEDLNNICKKHLLQEKILLVPSHSIGQQILQSMTRTGYSFLNLKLKTLIDIAQDLCHKELYNKNLHVINTPLAKEFLRETLTDLSHEGNLDYFSNLEITSGITDAIYTAVNDLKMVPLEVSDLHYNCFIQTNKCEDLKRIIINYEKKIYDKGFIDKADIYKLALNRISNSNFIYIIPSNLRLQPLEKEFLNKLSPQYHPVEFTPVSGINKSSSYFYKTHNKNENKAKLTSYLYNIENAPKNDKQTGIEIFKAYGESNEVKEIIRKVKAEEIPLDQVAVFYTSQEPYTQLFLNSADKLDIDVTFGQGININNSRPGKLLFSLLNWIKNDYPAAELYSMLISNYFNTNSKTFSSQNKLARILRNSEIGWGRERYFKYIEDESQQEKNYTDVNSLKELLQKLFSYLPEADNNGQINYSQLLKAAADFITAFSTIKNETDQKALEAVTTELQHLSANINKNLPFLEALNNIADEVNGLRIANSTPKPGAVYVDHFLRGHCVNRPYTFIIGLDAQRFPGQPREDSILLDIERKSIHNNINLSSEQIKINKYEMSQLLASLSGNVILSYTAFDTVENKEVFPSSFLLQVFRLIKNDATKNYSDFISSLSNAAGFIPENENYIIDESDWLFYKKLHQNMMLDSNILNMFPNMEKGITALNHRCSCNFTEFDGNINGDKNILDPRENHDFVLSSSQLELLAKCPFGFFIKHILKIKPPEEITYDPGVWLDNLHRGALLHSVFERFYKSISKDEKPRVEKHETMLYEIAEEIIQEYKQSLPPPSTLIFENERQEIFNSCKVFLLSEEENTPAVPEFLELAFGPLALQLPQENIFYVNGKIDRVDKIDKSLYRVLDYKTGSLYNFKTREYFKGGRQLQHILYAIALEQYLKNEMHDPNAKVSETGYIFPTIKGEGQLILRDRENGTNIYDILNELFDILAEGNFMMTDCEDDCKFCDYHIICEYSSISDYIKEKFSHDTALQNLRRLREYD